MNVYDESHIKPKSCGEDLIGLNELDHCRLWLTDEVYANHIGHYRYYSVFEGARVRSTVSSNNHSSVQLRNIEDKN